jgi:hypothetical protein
LRSTPGAGDAGAAGRARTVPLLFSPGSVTRGSGAAGRGRAAPASGVARRTVPGACSPAGVVVAGVRPITLVRVSTVGSGADAPPPPRRITPVGADGASPDRTAAGARSLAGFGRSVIVRRTAVVRPGRESVCLTSGESSGSRRKKGVRSDNDPEPSVPVPPPRLRRTTCPSAACGFLISSFVNLGDPLAKTALSPSRVSRSRIRSVVRAARSTRCDTTFPESMKVHPERSAPDRRIWP